VNAALAVNCKIFSKPARKQTTQLYIVLHAQQALAMHKLVTRIKKERSLKIYNNMTNVVQIKQKKNLFTGAVILRRASSLLSLYSQISKR
jgi:hypothetical protein